MGIIDFIKRAFSSEEIVKNKDNSEKEIEKKKDFTVEGLKEEINSEKNRIKDKNNEIKKAVLEYLENLISELNEAYNNLKKFDLNKKKEHEKIKLVVEENLNFYLNNLERLIDDLKKIDNNLGVKFLITRIQNYVNLFEKNSAKQYEKATILIGEDLAKIKLILKEFFKKVNEILIENKLNFEKEKDIEIIEKNLKELEGFLGSLKTLKKNYENLELSYNELIKEKETLEDNFKLFKDSSEFENYVKEREVLKHEINDFNREIMNLKDKVNLRFLIKYFHKDSKKSALLRDYHDNFIKALDEDENLNIVELVSEVLYIDIREDVKKFVRWNREIKEKNREHKVERKITLFEEGLRNIDIQLDSNKKQIESEKLKLEKFEKRKEEIVYNILNSAKTVFGQINLV